MNILRLIVRFLWGIWVYSMMAFWITWGWIDWCQMTLRGYVYQNHKWVKRHDVR